MEFRDYFGVIKGVGSSSAQGSSSCADDLRGDAVDGLLVGQLSRLAEFGIERDGLGEVGVRFVDSVVFDPIVGDSGVDGEDRQELARQVVGVFEGEVLVREFNGPVRG